MSYYRLRRRVGWGQKNYYPLRDAPTMFNFCLALSGGVHNAIDLVQRRVNYCVRPTRIITGKYARTHFHAALRGLPTYLRVYTRLARGRGLSAVFVAGGAMK